jgi:hypothetical protein
MIYPATDRSTSTGTTTRDAAALGADDRLTHETENGTQKETEVRTQNGNRKNQRHHGGSNECMREILSLETTNAPRRRPSSTASTTSTSNSHRNSLKAKRKTNTTFAMTTIRFDAIWVETRMNERTNERRRRRTGVIDGPFLARRAVPALQHCIQ